MTNYICKNLQQNLFVHVPTRFDTTTLYLEKKKKTTLFQNATFSTFQTVSQKSQAHI
jgi:hypothetical protein